MKPFSALFTPETKQHDLIEAQRLKATLKKIAALIKYEQIIRLDYRF